MSARTVTTQAELDAALASRSPAPPRQRTGLHDYRSGYRMNTIPEDAQRLADRLRMLADEIESAARYGIPIPYMVSVSGHQFGGASFHATEDEFAAWVDYTFGGDESAVGEDYAHRGKDWSRARVNVNGLPLEFACERATVEATS